MNSLFAIAPYKFEEFWVFDDPSVGLRQEPFVSGADVIMDLLTEHIPDLGRYDAAHEDARGRNVAMGSIPITVRGRRMVAEA